MNHPYSKEITVAFARNLARNLKHGPFPKPKDPVPSVDEAIAIIKQARHTCGFNWITGARCEEVLRLSRGERVSLT